MTMKKLTQMITAGIATATIIVSISGCNKDEKSTRDLQAQKRDQIAKRADKAVPIPAIDNFLNRKAIREYMVRMDDPSKTWYVYLISYTGTKIGYYVTRTHPISVCQLMTPPETEYDVWGNGQLGPAPTLDGVYAGSNSGCDHYYAFTADTDTLIEFSSDFFVSDQPLNIDAPELKQ